MLPQNGDLVLDKPGYIEYQELVLHTVLIAMIRMLIYILWLAYGRSETHDRKVITQIASTLAQRLRFLS
jgi:hypothetical protein